MSDSREFLVIDLGKMVNSSDAISSELNRKAAILVPKNREVHFLQALSHDGHVWVFLRTLEPRPAAGKAAK